MVGDSPNLRINLSHNILPDCKLLICKDSSGKCLIMHIV